MARRQRAEQRRPSGRSRSVPPLRRLPPPRRSTRIAAPEVFSLIEAPDEATAFLERLWAAAGGYRVYLDLASIQKVSIDAITALIAAVRSSKETSGNTPSQDAARELLIESGFFEHVRARNAPHAPTQGGLRPRRSRKVEPSTAQELIAIGTKAVGAEPGPRPSSYRVLIECMSNTHNHAAAPSEFVRETWWCSVYGDRARRRLCFTFVDTGIGIFRSVKVRRWKRLFGGNVATLRGILERRVPSSTGQPFRGKGLPAIYDSLRAGRIERLVIIANDVFAEPGRDDFRTLRNPFRGTLLYWETR